MRKVLLGLVIVSTINLYAQDIKDNWLKDVSELENKLKSQDHLFSLLTKSKFSLLINDFKNHGITNNEEENYWALSKIINQFKDLNLDIDKSDLKKYPFRCSRFNNGIYITGVHIDYDTLKGVKLVAINAVPLSKIISKIKKYSDKNPIVLLNSKSLLEILKISDSDTLKLSVIMPNKLKKTFKLPYMGYYDEDELYTIIPYKTPFYKRKDNRWFWSYGINYGQQLYFKYNIGLSKEYFLKMKDSLDWNIRTAASKNNIYMQAAIDAPKFKEFSEKIIAKFKKRRYKKLFIDLRGNTKGSIITLREFINTISKHKRLKKRKRVYLFIDKTMSSSALATVLELQRKVKVKIIGEEVTNSVNDTSDIEEILLPKTEITLTYPIRKFNVVTIIPDLRILQSFENYKSGVDAVLQKALDY